MYNTYLLIINNKNTTKKKTFNITTIQTNNIYNININKFSTKEERTIKEAKILYKLKNKLPFSLTI
jgi:hypothetical protein